MYILAIDEGTSSTRAMLYSLQGQLIHKSQYSITQYYPQPGWVEHDPEEIWQKTLLAIRDVVAHVPTGQIIACGLTNQRETTLIWDKRTGQCLANAMVWQDRRTEDFCASLKPHTDLIQAKTGLLPDPYFSASKLRWLLTTIPEAQSLAKQGHLAFGTIDTYLLWRLTKGKAHLTDVTNASRTLLFNIHTQQWDNELLDLFAIPQAILPEVYASDAYFGTIDSDYVTGSIPIHGIAGDQQAALIGQCCFNPGMLKATLGTGGFLLLNTGEQAVHSKHRLLTTIAYRIQNKTIYGLEGNIYQAGTSIRWLRDELKLLKSAEESAVLAASLPHNEGVYLLPAFSGLGSPHWLSNPGAALLGLSPTSNRAHFARAALESVGYQVRDILTCMQENSLNPLSVIRVDGGMTQNSWLLQFIASLNNCSVQHPKEIETTSFGVAMLAAIGCQAIDSLNTLATHWQCVQEYQSKHSIQHERDYQGWLSTIELFCHKPL